MDSKIKEQEKLDERPNSTIIIQKTQIQKERVDLEANFDKNNNSKEPKIDK